MSTIDPSTLFLAFLVACLTTFAYSPTDQMSLFDKSFLMGVYVGLGGMLTAASHAQWHLAPFFIMAFMNAAHYTTHKIAMTAQQRQRAKAQLRNRQLLGGVLDRCRRTLNQTAAR